MSKTITRFMKSQAGLTSDGGDWLTLNKLTEAISSEDNTEAARRGKVATKSEALAIESSPRWLNSTNISEQVLLEKVFSKQSECVAEIATPASVKRALKVGTSIIQALEDASSEEEFRAASLSIPHYMDDLARGYFGISHRIEIVCDAVVGFDKTEFLRTVVLPRQIEMIKRKMEDPFIFMICRNQDEVDLLRDHGWQEIEADLETLLSCEMRGLSFDPDQVWMKAPK